MPNNEEAFIQPLIMKVVRRAPAVPLKKRTICTLSRLSSLSPAPRRCRCCTLSSSQQRLPYEGSPGRQTLLCLPRRRMLSLHTGSMRKHG